MTDQPSRSREVLRRAFFYAALWLISLAGLMSLLSEFRAENVVEIFGQTYTGGDAVVALAVLAIGPITLLALAIRELHRYFR